MGGAASTFDDAVASMSHGTSVEDAARTIVAKMTPEEKLWCLDGDVPFWAGLEDLGNGGYHKRTFPAGRVERLGVPGFSFSDGPRGVVIGPATCFPVTMARGATWDLDLEERIGQAIGKEVRAVGADLFGGVCVNLLRHPAWGRAQETYGEDPFHVGQLGAALVRGVQRHAMATVKHFACNSMENSRFKVDVTIDEVALHEVFLPHFRRIVDEGVAVVMTAYNSVNGEWCGQHHSLLADVLRGEWAFEGFVISDWIYGIRDPALSVEAGLDVEMPYRMVRAARLPTALESGDLTWEDVDRSVVRTISTLLRFNAVLSRPRPDVAVLASPEHRALAREASAKAVVLLRNEVVGEGPVLPLRSEGITEIAVIGALAALRNTGDGGSSDVWAPEVVTPLQGLQAALPAARVVRDDGIDPASAAAAARSADVAIVVVGYTKSDEGEFIGGDIGTGRLRDLLPGPDDPALAASFTESVRRNPGQDPPADVKVEGSLSFATGGDRSSLRLHEADEELIRAVARANPMTVVVVVAGSAVLMAPWDAEVPAIVQSWYGGMEGGHGLADVLLGRCNADGRLPFSVPASAEHLPEFKREAEAIIYDRWHGWWKLERDGHAAHFPFGFGLSYTTFEWESFTASKTGSAITVRGSVTNTGDRRGADVVQVYGGRVGEVIADRPRRLLAFARAQADPGETSTVELTIPLAQLAMRDPVAHEWTAAHGTFALEVARHAGDTSAQVILIDLPFA